MLKSFTDFIGITNKQHKNNSIEFQNVFCSELGGKIAERTPVRTGLAKGNWQATDDVSPQPQRNTDKSSGSSRAKNKIYKEASQIRGVPDGRVIYVSNGVDAKDSPDPLSSDDEGGYIIQLEEGASPQAPHGMVYITLAQLEQIKKRAKRRLK